MLGRSRGVGRGGEGMGVDGGVCRMDVDGLL